MIASRAAAADAQPLTRGVRRPIAVSAQVSDDSHGMFADGSTAMSGPPRTVSLERDEATLAFKARLLSARSGGRPASEVLP